MRLAVKVLGPGVIENAQSDIAGASGYIENLDAATWVELGHKVILPQSMDTQ